MADSTQGPFPYAGDPGSQEPGFFSADDGASGLSQGTVRLKVRVRGSSMAPLIESGDIVFLENDPLRPPRPGDVIVFRTLTGLFVHRVIGVKWSGETRLICQKGDAGPGFSWIENAAVVGVVRSIEKKGRIYSLSGMSARAMSQWIRGLSLISLAAERGLALLGRPWMSPAGQVRLSRTRSAPARLARLSAQAAHRWFLRTRG